MILVFYLSLRLTQIIYALLDFTETQSEIWLPESAEEYAVRGDLLTLREQDRDVLKLCYARAFWQSGQCTRLTLVRTEPQMLLSSQF